MGEILGVGCTHYSGLMRGPQSYTNILRMVIKNKVASERMRDPANWPAGARDEWERQEAESLAHEERLVSAFRELRHVIDGFQPDALIIWGDDQYENFHEDLVPPLVVHLDEEFRDVKPLLRAPDNSWHEPVDKAFTWRGNRELAKYIASQLLQRDFPISYSYRPLHAEQGLAQAFANTLLYLDWNRTPEGFPYPIIPISVNALGRNLIVSKEGFGHLRPELVGQDLAPMQSPPGPSPRTCYRLGKLVREIVEERPERIVLMASSSWSHSFLTKKTEWLFPDHETDREHFAQLKRGEQHKWADMGDAEVEEAGGHEWKTWVCLAGAMEDRAPTIVDYVESWVFNSNKCFCYFAP